MNRPNGQRPSHQGAPPTGAHPHQQRGGRMHGRGDRVPMRGRGNFHHMGRFPMGRGQGPVPFQPHRGGPGRFPPVRDGSRGPPPIHGPGTGSPHLPMNRGRGPNFMPIPPPPPPPPSGMRGPHGLPMPQRGLPWRHPHGPPPNRGPPGPFLNGAPHGRGAPSVIGYPQAQPLLHGLQTAAHVPPPPGFQQMRPAPNRGPLPGPLHAPGRGGIPNHHQQLVQEQPRGPLPFPSQVPPTPNSSIGLQAAAQPPVQNHTPEQVDSAWAEHTAPNGVKFYHNSVLKVSVHEKPAILKAKETLATGEWKEYTDNPTGKIYYSNGAITTWERPVDFVEAAGATATPSPVSNGEKNGTHSNGSEAKKKRKRTETTVEFGDKVEGVAGFKELLLACDISPTSKWNEVVKLCQSDMRWDACDKILSTGERKQALAEYQTKRANDLRASERQERAQAKAAFHLLLAESLTTANGFSPWNSHFSDIRDALATDARFQAVPDENTRQSLFLDFCEEFRKRDERRKRSKMAETKDSFILFLKEKEKEGKLNSSTTWGAFFSSLDDKDKSDSRVTTSAAMPDDKRQMYFSDFVSALHSMEEECRRRITDARRWEEKVQRDAYRGVLRSLAENLRILPSSRWRTAEELLSSDQRFLELQEQGREVPRELFEEFVNEWNDVYRSDRALLSKCIRPETTKGAAEGVSYETFVQSLFNDVNENTEHYREVKSIVNRNDPVSSAKMYYNELLMRSKGIAGPVTRPSTGRRRIDYESSEDEGEIVEEGAIEELRPE